MGDSPSQRNCTASNVASSYKRNYQFITTDGYLFGVISVDSRVGEGPRTTHLSYHKVSFWLDGGNFVSSQSRDYPSMIHYTKYSSSSSLSCSREDQNSAAGDGGGDVGPRTNQFSSQKYDFCRDRHYVGFSSYHHRRKYSPMA